MRCIARARARMAAAVVAAFFTAALRHALTDPGRARPRPTRSRARRAVRSVLRHTAIRDARANLTVLRKRATVFGARALDAPTGTDALVRAGAGCRVVTLTGRVAGHDHVVFTGLPAGCALIRGEPCLAMQRRLAVLLRVECVVRIADQHRAFGIAYRLALASATQLLRLHAGRLSGARRLADFTRSACFAGRPVTARARLS